MNQFIFTFIGSILGILYVLSGFRGSPAEHCVHGITSPGPSERLRPRRALPASGPDSVDPPDGERQEGAGWWYHRPGQTAGTVLYTQALHTSTHTVIYYSNKSLAPPNFLWISISPWTYLHWSTSGVRMCQASLTVTLRNGHTCVCVCVPLSLSSPVCVCRSAGFVHMQRFCSTQRRDTNPWAWVITSENVRITQTETAEWGLEILLFWSYLASYTESGPDYEKQLNIILAPPTVSPADRRAGYKSPFEMGGRFVVFSAGRRNWNKYISLSR